MSNTSSAKGNPASKRMMNPNNKAKRARNKAKNEQLRAKGQHPKQLRANAQKDRAIANLSAMADLGLGTRQQVRAFRKTALNGGTTVSARHPQSIFPSERFHHDSQEVHDE